MKTIVHVELSDEEREQVAQSLGHSGLVTRKQVTAFVQNQVTKAIKGKLNDQGNKTDTASGEDPPGDSGSGGPGTGDRGVREEVSGRGFTPSRGDEPYLFKARDPALRELHSNILDAIQALEDYTWEQMEKNRE